MANSRSAQIRAASIKSVKERNRLNNQAVSEFDTALGQLQAAEENTPAIEAALKKSGAQWAFSRAGFRLSGDSRYVPTVITTTTETLLWQMNDLTTAYEGVMSSRLVSALP